MKVLRLGHAMYVLTSNGGSKFLIDPFFEMNPGCPEDYQTDEFLATIDTVVLTHGHFDHTSGLERLTQAKPDVLIVAQYELAMILIQKGCQNVMPLNFGGQFQVADAELTMVAARHTSSYGETEGTPIYAGDPCGYIFDFEDDLTLYHSGDTAMMADMKLIQDVYQPDMAILSASGHFTMNPKEAAYVVEHLLNVKTVIPSHTFPSKEKAASKETFDGLVAAFPVISYMVDRDKELEALLKDYPDTIVDVLGYGEEKTYRL